MIPNHPRQPRPGYISRQPIKRPNKLDKLVHTYSPDDFSDDEHFASNNDSQLALQNRNIIDNLKMKLKEIKQQLSTYQKQITTKIDDIELKPGPMGLDGLPGPANTQQVVALGRVETNKPVYLAIEPNRFLQRLVVITATTADAKLIVGSNGSSQTYSLDTNKPQQVLDLDYQPVTETTSYSFELDGSSEQSLLQLLVVSDYDQTKEDDLVTVVYRF